MKHILTRRAALSTLGSLGIGGLPGMSLAQSGPGVATIVIGLAAGGATDMAARRLSEGMRGAYASSVLVDNRTGAGGRIAIQHVKAAAPNGATLLLTPASMMTLYPHTYKDLGYDPVKDFVPVGMVSTSEVGFAIGPAVPESVGSLNDYLAWIKSNPDSATFGHGATGSGPHFLGELLGRLLGVKMVQTGFRGSQPAIVDLLGGHITAVAAPLGEFLPHMKTGKIRVLGVTGANRSRFLTNVPTFKELHIALSEMTEWFGVFMPAGTPAQAVQQASAAMKSAVANPELVKAYAMMGMEAGWSSPEGLSDRLKNDIKRWQAVAEKIGFTAQS